MSRFRSWRQRRQLKRRPIWYAFSPCGCMWAWLIDHPRDMTPESQTLIDDGPGVSVWLRISGGQFKLNHQIHAGEERRVGPVLYRECDWVDRGIEGCLRDEDSVQQGRVLDAWFPMVKP